MRTSIRLLGAALLALAPAALLSCGSANGLIPAAQAGPLQSDFEEVARAAAEGNGSCVATAAAIRKTERDLHALPASVDAGLRRHLREGIDNLRERALVMCAQPAATSSTATSTTSSHTSTPTTTSTSTSTTTSTSTSTSTEAAPPPNGGTEVPSEETPQEIPPAGGEGKEAQGESGGAGSGR